MYGSVLVIGGGIAGIHAAMELAEHGVKVILIEMEPVIGGTMAARLSDEHESLNLGRGMAMPQPATVAAHENIELLALSRLISLEGDPGQFTATIHQRARYVTDACTQCNRCHVACPSVVPNEYQSGLTYRKAIYTPFRNAVPHTYAIDLDHCLNKPPNYFPCQRCVEVCEDHAIHFHVPQETVLTREISSVIIAVGFSLANPDPLKEFGYGECPDVVTYMELERLTSSVGPTGGYLEKVSNEATPESLLYVIADASRWSCLCAAAQIDRLGEQGIQNVTVLHPPVTSYGETFTTFWNKYVHHSVNLVQGELERLTPGEDNALRARYKKMGDYMTTTQDYDMAVFTTAVQPVAGLAPLAETLRIDLDENGFVKRGPEQEGLNATTRPGVYTAGCSCGPKDVAGSIAESKSAAIYAMRHLERRRENNETKPQPRPMQPPDLQRQLETLLVNLTQLGGGTLA